MAADTGMVDDGTGVKEVFRVEMFDLVSIPEEQHGIFYSGDCYVILYAYNDGRTDRYIIYYWLGDHCSQDEAGAAALRWEIYQYSSDTELESDQVCRVG